MVSAAGLSSIDHRAANDHDRLMGNDDAIGALATWR